MEMPAIQTAVPGVLEGDLDNQLQALWHTLNDPTFVPPRPGAERVVQNHNLPNLKEHAKLVTSVIESDAKNYLRPLAIGLPNRQNVLFDLETAQWAAFWLGDTAAQYTRGKTWYWEFGGPFLNKPGAKDSDTRSKDPPVLQGIHWESPAGELWKPTQESQVAIQMDQIRHTGEGLQFDGAILLANQGQTEAFKTQQHVWAKGDSTTISSEVVVQGTNEGKYGKFWLKSDLPFRLEGNTAVHQSPTIEVKTRQAHRCSYKLLKEVSRLSPDQRSLCGLKNLHGLRGSVRLCRQTPCQSLMTHFRRFSLGSWSACPATKLCDCRSHVGRCQSL